MHKRCRLYNSRKTILFIIVLQTLLIASYFIVQDKSAKETSRSPSNVVFVLQDDQEKKNLPMKATYIFNTQVKLIEFVSTKEFFTDFNSSLCFNNGTDIKTMERRKYSNWKCECLPFWHGADCGQPESVWRALLTSQKSSKKRIIQRKFERRLIYLFPVQETELVLTEIRLGELWDVVDLFVLLDSDDTNNLNLKSRLDRGTLKRYHKKIMYLKVDSFKTCFSQVKKIIVNLKDDDLILYSNSNFDIPNNSSLKFLKMYNNFPLLLTTFRLRWSVFGFFWKHPQKTILSGYLTSIKIFQDLFNDNLELLSNSTANNRRLVIGDLNHFGGWFCEYCLSDPSEIVKIISNKSDKIKNNNVIDKTYLEDLIENGIYIDGKTELVRSHKFSEGYFAPNFVNENNFQFDFLLVNMYSKLDYYEN